jgi:hypothetical protein
MGCDWFEDKPLVPELTVYEQDPERTGLLDPEGVRW